MAHEKNHDYHILPPSIWPFLGAVGTFLLMVGGVRYMKGDAPWLLLAGLVMVLYVMYAWWADVVDESHEGDHTPVVQIGLRYGVLLFIASEVMFFVAFFWTFFKNAFYPMGAIEGITVAEAQWPPASIEAFDPWGLPLINTFILLLSGTAVTWAHHELVHNNNRKALVQGLTIAVVLGVIFTGLQAFEYSHALFGIGDTTYGGIFFMATGFHGFHVIIGTIFLFVCLMRARRGDFTQDKHLGFEAAAWYWHFVDVVWLFLFAAIYVWGS
ncbi:cytochrome c oxidase subunit 3 [Paracoccaceae bacterium GXU_MW_L88]